MVGGQGDSCHRSDEGQRTLAELVLFFCQVCSGTEVRLSGLVPIAFTKGAMSNPQPLITYPPTPSL